MIFTTEFEKNYAEKHAPWIKGRTTIIPIGSNIPRGKRTRGRKKQVVHFGLIYPKKNIEDFIKLAELAYNTGLKIEFKIVGKLVDKAQAYYANLKENCNDLPIEWLINLSDVDVANILAESTFAYLPFPDGASERRASLLAVLSNGVVTITNEGKFTPISLNSIVKFAKTPEEALQIIKNLVSNDVYLQTLSEKSKEYAKKFSWQYVVKKHIEIYEEACGGSK